MLLLMSGDIIDISNDSQGAVVVIADPMELLIIGDPVVGREPNLNPAWLSIFG
jgi:hypothetical protein